MGTVVMKFGGTSLANLSRMERIAKRVAEEVRKGSRVAVVVSAMAGETDRLVSLTKEISGMVDLREYDAIVASGEQVSAALVALALQREGIEARSWQAWQIPIQTNDVHGFARIADISTAKISQRMAEGQVAVVAGFQGVSPLGRVTTLGRGGSDTSAVALAAALKADRCDIFTDVEGVYTCDPRVVPKARKLDQITYEEMLEFASQGAKVLQTRSVELAIKHGVCLQVRSSFSDSPGTKIVKEREDIMEGPVVSGIACSTKEAKLSLLGVRDQPGVASLVFGILADRDVNVDMIVQNISTDGTRTDVTFTVGEEALSLARRALEENKQKLSYEELLSDGNVAKVSVIGVGMRSHPGVASRMFRTLASLGINIQVISTSEIKIAVLIERAQAETAVKALHDAFRLEAPGLAEA